MKDNSILIVVSGPSGVGKDTVVKEMMKINSNFYLSVSATTRKPRKNEIDGVNYYFFDKNKFDSLVLQNKFLEYNSYCDNSYGTLRSEITNNISLNKDIILIIEVNGGLELRDKCQKELGLKCVLIYILPPSLSVLEHRLKDRSSETKKEIRKRLSVVKKEIMKGLDYDYFVVNDNYFNCAIKILDIINKIKTE
ncbi:MAG: guanylate kinase [Candidatus Improbicoccus pseudotrichonymphae]|uniref:Guanylate kinase n=1 Tax=Candidatus Improbicoccus pseudotrichonymphae TaxID=3033792 RepID=A0AA48IB14_9FIRM|nr:MAG: guanylate kinase [Candidatus Improbicoccus pseudotrichonymphae]